MKLAAAQFQPAAGDLEQNLTKHLVLIQQAAVLGCQLILFPELSLTGYEPKLAAALATEPGDPRLDVLQQLSDEQTIVIGAGLPLRTAVGIEIGQVFFQPHQPRESYAKQLLHADELPYFVPGRQQLLLHCGGLCLAPAICFESLQPIHAEQASQSGAQVYLASVAKSARGVERAYVHYPLMARQHALTVLMANAIGPADDFVSAGRSGAWNSQGELISQLDQQEGLVVIEVDEQ